MIIRAGRVVFCAFLAFGLGGMAEAGFVPEGSHMSYTITHASGFTDAQGQPISSVLTSDDRFGGDVAAGPIGPPLYKFPKETLPDDDTAGFSQAGGALWVRAYPGAPYVITAPHFMSSVSQNNPAAPAAGPAILRLAFDGVVPFEPVSGPSILNRVMMKVGGTLGSGADAFIQFEAVQTMETLDVDGNILATNTVRIGGDQSIMVGYLQGGGRIDHTIPGLDGEVYFDSISPSLYIANWPPYYPTFFGPSVTTEPFPPPPYLPIDPAMVAVRIYGFYELQAKNDGSPSGIFLGDPDATVVPEPSSLIILALVGLAAVRQRGPMVA